MATERLSDRMRRADCGRTLPGLIRALFDNSGCVMDVMPHEVVTATQTALDEARAAAELTAQHVENLETMLAALRVEIASADERVREAEIRAALAERQFEDFASSRGGRALDRYIRMKRKVLGKGEAE